MPETTAPPDNTAPPHNTAPPDTPLRVTPLRSLHQELGGRIVPFAGWELPIQYEGVIAEHTWCRNRAALFDVSHMGVVELKGRPVKELIHHLEALTPASLATLEAGRQRYGLLTNEGGGVIDDLMITNRGDHLSLVVNASRRDVDLIHLRTALEPAGVEVIERTDVALLALQGPQAVDALSRLIPEASGLVFMDHVVLERVTIGGADLGPLAVARSGYTGEDGFEVTVAADQAEILARTLLAQPEVAPAGLGARDTHRLEAGLPLYGHDLDETTSPIEADLAWTVPKRRRADARFPGADRILAELDRGPSRRRVGLAVTGRRPVRDGAPLRSPADTGPAGTDLVGTDLVGTDLVGTDLVGTDLVGTVTSGGYGPTVGAPVAMAYVTAELSTAGQTLIADVRGTEVEVRVASLPFTPHRYHRGA